MRFASAARAALALAALPLLACGSPTLAQEQADRLVVESVEVRLLESSPVQVSASVTGYLRDGCETLGATTQSRSGNAITVTIATSRDASRGQGCIQVITPVQQEVRLEGRFEAGAYVVSVNGLERTFLVG